MKTVFILGAGFSVEAGAPTQASIMNEIQRINVEDEGYFKREDYILFEKLLKEQLYYKEEQYPSIEIEDLFTPLDRCLADNVQFKDLNIQEIIKTREAIFNIIGRTIRKILNETNKDKTYIDLFAEFLVEKCRKRMNKNYRNTDPVSVITTNWDILLDNSIYNYIQNNYPGKAVVDYCCYISSLREDDPTIKPGLEMLGDGGFNVKLLKVHGSLNWLQCPRCMRLYAGFDEKKALSQSEICRHCNKNHNGNNRIAHSANKLTANLIMPTFIKDLSNPQYKIIWQNAGIELSEANKIVFIGYSLPSADFEIRQLLSRMVRCDVEIEVVSYDKNPTKKKRDAVKTSWESFFGNRKITIHLCGASKYIKRTIKAYKY